MELSRIEKLPRTIVYCKELYQLRMWVNAAGNLVLGYAHISNPLNKILSVVVDGNGDNKLVLDDVKSISDSTSLSCAVIMLEQLLDKCLFNNTITIMKEE